MGTEKTEDKLSWGCWMRTLFAASGPIMMYVFFGITEAQSAILLPQLKEKSSYIHVTPDQETWIASLGILTAPIGSSIAGPIIDAIGRKKGILFFYINMGAGFGIIACATEVWHIYVGRSVCAFAVGLGVAALVYLAEICTKKQRSFFLAILSSIISGSVSLTYFIGAYLPWNIASGVFSLTCFIYFIIVCFTPESPAWLFKKSKLDATTRSLKQLGRTPSGILRELELLRLSNKENSEKFKLKELLEPTVWKPFIILTLFHLLNSATGVYHFLYYTVDFVQRLGTTYEPLTVTMAISVTRFLATFTIGFYFTAYVRRKTATVFSAVMMTLSLTGAGVYEYVYRNTDTSERPLPWIPVTLFTVNTAIGITGVATLPWVLPGEVFPLRMRGAMTGAIFVIATVLMFVFIKMYGVFVDTLQIWGYLFVCAATSFVLVFFGVFLVPETQNKTLYEVEQSFMPKKMRQRTVKPAEQQIEMAL